MCISYIKRFISQLPQGQIFTTRQVLIWGSRSAVDVALWRLVKAEIIVRLARGVFIRDGSKLPTLWEIAQAKCMAYAKRIARYGADLAADLKFLEQKKNKITFTTTGRTSSFWVGNILIHIKGISPRKMQINQTKTGQALAALWYLGNHDSTKEFCETVWRSFCLRHEHKQLKLDRVVMPEWLGRHFLGNSHFILNPIRANYQEMFSQAIGNTQ